MNKTKTTKKYATWATSGLYPLSNPSKCVSFWKCVAILLLLIHLVAQIRVAFDDNLLHRYNQNDTPTVMKKPNRLPPGHLTSSSDYSWVGNRWDPPEGVPVYKHTQMREVFQDFNTLWVGDSHGRQEMNTMFSLMNATNPFNITVLELDQNINHCKYGFTFTSWKIPRGNHGNLGNHGNHGDHCEFNETIQNNGNNNNSTGSLPSPHPLENELLPSKGYFDYYVAKCSSAILHLINSNYFARYDLVVVDYGLHEIMDMCESSNGTAYLDGILDVLETLQELTTTSSEPNNFSVLWKTTGVREEWDKATWESPVRVDSKNQAMFRYRDNINLVVRNWFATYNPPNMHLIDWERQIRPRATGQDRIKGDIAAHFGLELRLLTAQMVTHTVVTEVR